MAANGSWTFRLCLVAATLLHGGVLTLALAWTVPADMSAPEPEAIVVSILSAEALDAKKEALPQPVPAAVHDDEPAMDAAESMTRESAGAGEAAVVAATATPLQQDPTTAEAANAPAAAANSPRQDRPDAAAEAGLEPVTPDPVTQVMHHDGTEDAAPTDVVNDPASPGVAAALRSSDDPQPTAVALSAASQANPEPLIDHAQIIESPVQTATVILQQQTPPAKAEKSLTAAASAETASAETAPAKRAKETARKAEKNVKPAEAVKTQTLSKPGSSGPVSSGTATSGALSSAGKTKKSKLAGAGASKTVSSKGATAGFTASSAANLGSYMAQVRSRVASRKPAGGGGRGTTQISFGLTTSGGLRYARIIRSSGNPALDRSVLAAVQSAAPFPPAPAGVSQAKLNFSMPFMFR